MRSGSRKNCGRASSGGRIRVAPSTIVNTSSARASFSIRSSDIVITEYAAVDAAADGV